MTPKEKKLALWARGILIKDIADRFKVDPSYVTKIIQGDRTNDKIERFIEEILQPTSNPTQ